MSSFSVRYFWALGWTRDSNLTATSLAGAQTEAERKFGAGPYIPRPDGYKVIEEADRPFWGPFKPARDRQTQMASKSPNDVRRK